MLNIINNVDSYKSSHYKGYPPETEQVFSYFESRGGRFPSILFYGLQYILKDQFIKPITYSDVDQAARLFEAHGLPFNRGGWDYIVEKLNGKLPLRIRAVAEGSLIPNHNVLFTVENTDPKCFWLTSWVETALVRSWYPCTVATQSFFIKKMILEYLRKTSDDPENQINFKLHDFGSRGVSSQESAGIGGSAHLVNFLGTDTVTAMLFAMEHYRANFPPGFSIPAAEHSTITSWGKEHEVDAYRNMIKQFAKPNSLVAVVSDSYDLDNAVDHLWGEQLREEVIKSGALVVIRPDSGDPVTVVHRTMESLANNFGYYINNKGFKVLKHVRVIQGDGVNEHSIKQILEKLTQSEYSIDNIAFGMGGQLLQVVNRDTNRFAYKCSSITVNGEDRDVFKDPITDPGKRSKAGRLDLIKTPEGEYRTINYLSQESVLETVYLNGELVKEYTFEQIRKNANLNLNA